MGDIDIGSAVWIKDPQKDSQLSFVKGEVKKYTEGRGYTVQYDGKEKVVRAADVSHANPDGMSAPDNCYLVHISEATILENMKARFKGKKIYTFTGSILLAVNPFEVLPIYGQDIMKPYVGKILGSVSVEPSVYSMAEESYKTLVKTKLSQSLVVSGESGSGKTETNKHLMYYLAYRSKAGGGIETRAEAKIHVEALAELGLSLEAEITPRVIELEDRTVMLSGNVEDQYHQWRDLLAEIYRNEVGALAPPEAEDGSGADGSGGNSEG